MKKKLTVAAAALMLLIGTIGLLTACGGSDKPQITDAASLAAASQKALEGVENFHVDMDMDMEMTMKMDGLKEVMGTDSMTVPAKIKTNLDSGKETAHGTTEVKMSMMNQPMDQAAEIYIDLVNGVTYTKAEGTEAWIKTDSDASMSDMMSSLSTLGTDVLEQAEFSESEDGYVLTLDASVMGEAIKESDMLGNYVGSGLDLETFDITGGQFVYTFDKESTRPIKIEMKDVDMKAKGETQGTAVDILVPMNAAIVYSQYGEIDPGAYEIPAEVTGGSN